MLAHELRRRVVENLLDNAAGHGGAADIEVTVRPDPDRGEVDLLVADRGPGRGSDRGPEGLPTASGVRAGHGIGLVLVRGFLDAARGRSWLAERQGGGTVVGLSLPLRQGQALEDAVNT
ncbi:MAG: ATP-binding protein [Acidimicrobiia bacterium]